MIPNAGSGLVAVVVVVVFVVTQVVVAVLLRARLVVLGHVADVCLDGRTTGLELLAGAEKLEVNVITAKGQNRFEVSRKRPSLSLAGMI